MECPTVHSVGNEKPVLEVNILVKKEPDVDCFDQKDDGSFHRGISPDREEKPYDSRGLHVQNKENETENMAADYSTECIVKVEAESYDFEDGDESGVDETTEAVPVCMISKRHDNYAADRNDNIECSVTTGTVKKAKVEKSKHDFQCDKCRKVFQNTGKLNRHKLIHLEDKPFKCDKCDYCACAPHNLKEHQQRHEGLYFVCDVCSAIFYRKSGLKNHMRKLHNIISDGNYKPTHFQGETSPKFFICNVCNKKFKEEHKFKQHIGSHDENQISEPDTYQQGNKARPYKCEECDKSYNTPKDLKTHIALHSQVNPFSCEFCKKCFPTAFHLRKHRYIHTKVKNLSCKTCGEQFSSMSRLSSHEVKHSDSKPHVCSICNKSYPRQKSLKRHMLTHDGSKPHLCSICGKSFAAKESLTAHKRCHSDEKPYCCDFCGKLFRHSSDLRRHKLTHGDDFPHDCEICGKKFRLRDNMMKHMRAHDPEVKRERNIKRQHRYRRQKEIRSNAKDNSCIGRNADQEHQKEAGAQKMPTGLVLHKNEDDMAHDRTHLRSESDLTTTIEKLDKSIAVTDKTLSHDTCDEERISDNLTEQQLKKDGSDSNVDDKNRDKNAHIGIDFTPTSCDAQDVCLHEETEEKPSCLGASKPEVREFIDSEVAMPNDKDIDNDETTVIVIYSNNVENELLTENSTPVNQNTGTDVEEVIHQNLCVEDSTVSRKERTDANELSVVKGHRIKKGIAQPVQILHSDESQRSDQTIDTDKSGSEMRQIYGVGFQKFRITRRSNHETDIEQTHQCKICDINFRLYDTLLMHMVHVHDMDEEEAENFC